MEKPEYARVSNTKQTRATCIKNPWDTFLGDCSVVDHYLIDKPLCCRWFLPHFANVFFRAIGQLAFVNNPLAGAMILAVVFATNWRVAIGTVVGGSVATIVEMILMLQDWKLMRSGVAPFNAVLVGTVLQGVSPFILHNDDLQPLVFGFIVFGSIASLFFCSAMNNFFSRFSIPYLALPFNVVAICSFTFIKNSNIVLKLTPDLNSTQFEVEEIVGNLTTSNIDWLRVAWGVWASFGQIWAVNADLLACCLFSTAIFMASPLLLASAGVGAMLGTLGGVTLTVFLPEPDSSAILEEIYAGLWGLNTILSMASLSCVFFACNRASISLAVVNVAFTVLAQYGLRCVMTVQYGLPVLTLPFVLSTMLLIMTSDERASLSRIHEAMGYPERHAYRRYTLTRSARKEAERNRRMAREMKDVSSKLIETQP